MLRRSSGGWPKPTPSSGSGSSRTGRGTAVRQSLRRGGLLPVFAAVAVGALAACSEEEEQRDTAETVLGRLGEQQGAGAAAGGETLLREAAEAANLGRNDIAAETFDRAADLFEAAGDRAGMGRVLLGRGTLAHHSGQIEVARAHYARAREEFAAAGDGVGEARVSLAVGELERSRFNNAEALAAFEDAAARFHEVEEWRLEAEALVGIGDSERRLRNILRSRDALERARAIFDVLGDAQGARLAEQAWDELLTYFDEYDDARAAHERELDEALHADDPIRQMEAELALARIDVGAGRLDAAREAFGAIARGFVEAGDSVRAGGAWLALAELEWRLGRLDVAAAVYERARAAYGAAGAPEGEALALIGLGGVETAWGEDARPRYAAARALVPESESARVDGALLLAQGRLERRAGRPGEARQAFARAHDVFTAVGLTAGAAQASLAHAGLERDDGRAADAHASYARALEGFAETRDRIGEAEAREGLASVFEAAGDVMEARVQYRVAAAIFDELGRGERAAAARAAATRE